MAASASPSAAAPTAAGSNSSTSSSSSGPTERTVFHYLNSKSEHWQQDSKASACPVCTSVFTTTLRRHHCRACGLVYCDKCASTVRPDSSTSKDKAEYRLCTDCHDALFKRKTSAQLIKAARAVDTAQIQVLLDRGFVDYGDALNALLVAYRSVVVPGSTTNGTTAGAAGAAAGASASVTRRGSGGAPDAVMKSTLAAASLLLKYGSVVTDRAALHSFMVEASPATMMIAPAPAAGATTPPLNPYDVVADASIKELWALADKGVMSWQTVGTERGCKIERKQPDTDKEPEILRHRLRVTTPIQQVLQLLLNPHRRAEWDDQLDSLEIVHTVDSNRRVFLSRTKAAWPVAPRTSVYLQTWRLLSRDGEPERYAIAHKMISLESCPQVRGTIRAKHYLSGFVLRATSKGEKADRAAAAAATGASTATAAAEPVERTELQYISQIDMCGALPGPVTKAIRLTETTLLSAVDAACQRATHRTVADIDAAAAASSASSAAASSTATAAAAAAGSARSSVVTTDGVVALKPMKAAAGSPTAAADATPTERFVFDPAATLPADAQTFFTAAHGPFSDALVAAFKARQEAAAAATAAAMAAAAKRASVGAAPAAAADVGGLTPAEAVALDPHRPAVVPRKKDPTAPGGAASGSLIIQRPSVHMPTPLGFSDGSEEPDTPTSPPPPPPPMTPGFGAASAAGVGGLGAVPELGVLSDASSPRTGPSESVSLSSTSSPGVGRTPAHSVASPRAPAPSMAAGAAAVGMSHPDDSAVGVGAMIMVTEKRPPAPSVAVPGAPVPTAPAGFVPDHKRPSFIPPPPPMLAAAAAAGAASAGGADAPPPPPPADDDDTKRPTSAMSESVSLVLAQASESPVATWSANSVIKWLRATALAPPFLSWIEASPANAVDGALLADLDDAMLCDAGVRNKIHRVKLLQAIAALKERDAATAAVAARK